MVSNGKITNVNLCYFLFICVQASGNTDLTQDQTTSRANTLFDDADDIQKQLNNEARDRMKYGHAKTIWVFHFPTQFPEINSIDKTRRLRRESLHKKTTSNQERTKTLPANPKEWNYEDQDKWYKSFPDCGGRLQSPVDLPSTGLVKVKGARKLFFCNYDTAPKSLTLFNDGTKVMLHGEWNSKHRPLVYGGGAHSRRFVFHSLTLHWPSEHTIGGLQYPLESQALHVSAEYRTIDEALRASHSDPMAFLGIVNLYKFSNHTQKGLKELLTIANKGATSSSISPQPLSFYNPPFKEYVCYYGSLTSPPCTESVLWFVRARALHIDRKTMEAAHKLYSPANNSRKLFFRQPQPLNDRKIFFFNK